MEIETVKKWGSSIIVVILLFLMQTSVLPYFSFGKAVPNLLVMITCIYAILRGERDGIYTGFACGVLLDAFYMNVVGIHALIYLYIGYVCGLTHSHYEEQDARMPLIVIVLGDLAALLLEYLLFYVLRGNFCFRFYLGKIMIPEILYTLVLAVIAFPLLVMLERRFVTAPAEEQTEKLSDLEEGD